MVLPLFFSKLHVRKETFIVGVNMPCLAICCVTIIHRKIACLGKGTSIAGIKYAMFWQSMVLPLISMNCLFFFIVTFFSDFSEYLNRSCYANDMLNVGFFFNVVLVSLVIF